MTQRDKDNADEYQSKRRNKSIKSVLDKLRYQQRREALELARRWSNNIEPRRDDGPLYRP
jgi:hypothetical protein